MNSKKTERKFLENNPLRFPKQRKRRFREV
jgi:hypothetical protein